MQRFDINSSMQGGWTRWTVLPLAAVLVLAGCSGIPFIGDDGEEQEPEDVELWSFFDQTVRLVPRESGAPNDHPVRLSPEEIRIMLGELRYRLDEDEEAAPVFTDDNLQTLGQALSEGLAQARPDQDVALAIAGYSRAGGWLPVKRVNVARAFYRDGELNLIFNQVLDYYRGTGSSSDTSHWEFGSREEPAELEGGFIQQPGFNVSASRGDWVTIDTRYAEAGDIPAPVESAAESEEAYRPPAEYDGDPALRRRVDTLELELDEAREDLRESENSGLSEPPSQGRGDSTAGVAERLTILKHLREVGLITEEIYRERVNMVLDEL